MLVFALALVFAVPLLVFLCNSALNRFTSFDSHRTPFLAGYIVTVITIAAFLLVQASLCAQLTLWMLVGCVYILVYCGCVTFLNWFLFTLTDVSMHVRIAYILFRSQGMGREDIKRLYNKQIILRNRTARLLELGQIKLENGYFVSGGGEVLLGAAVCKLLRRLLGIPVSPELQDHSTT